jgi:hypothetical protein
MAAASVSAILSMAFCAAITLTSWMSARTVMLPPSSARRWPCTSPIRALTVGVAVASARLRRAALIVRRTASTTEAFETPRSAFSLSLSSEIRLLLTVPTAFQPMESKSDASVITPKVTVTTDR